MGKLLEFKIVVESQTLNQDGRNITGQVILNLKEPMKMRGLTLTLTGEAYCHWTEEHGPGHNRHTVSQTGKQELLNMTSFLYGQGEGSDSSMHPSGRLVYPFVFVIPLNLPSSFVAAHGHIKYCLKANIDRPWKFDHNIEQPLQIIEAIDTNEPHFLANPGGSVSQEIGCCFPDGILVLDAYFCRSAFCPGESIMINATANNQSNTTMKGMKAKLCKIIEYHATTKTQIEKHVISIIARPMVLAGGTGTFDNEALTVPGTEPTIDTSVIKCQYVVQIEVNVPCGIDLDIKLPVTIGNVPFRGDFGMANNPTTFAAPASTFGMAVAPQPPTSSQAFPSVPMATQPQVPPLPPPGGFSTDMIAPPAAPPPSYEDITTKPTYIYTNS
eukprot:gene20079-22049_t